MNLVYLFSAMVLVVVLTAYGIISITKKDKLGSRLAYAFFLTASIYTLFFLGLVLNYESALRVFYSTAMAISNWVLFFVAMVIYSMCERHIVRPVKLAAIVLVAGDSLVLITNPVNNFAVTFESFVKNETVFLSVNLQSYFVVHEIISVLLASIMILALVHKLVVTSKYYRAKYMFPLVIVVAMLVSKIFVADFNGILDPAVAIMAACIITLYHACYNTSPKTLLRKLQIFVNDNISDATFIYDKDGRLLRLNERAKNLLDKDIWKDAKSLEDYLGYPAPEIDCRVEIGESIFSVILNPIHDEKMNYVAETFIFHEITEIEKRFEREQKVARIDTLTGALNRKGFFEAANDFLYKNESEAGFALVVSGICNFKGINSTYGTEAGDIVLKTIAKNFKDYHHSYPMIYGRTAEGKFGVLLPFDYVDEIAADMSFITVPVGEDLSIHVEMCHGYIVLSDISLSLDYYYERALIALSECKKIGNISTLEYSYKMEETMIRKHALVSEMHAAIREDQFFIELQPQIDMKDMKVSGAEALVRWKHPSFGRISPGEFIPLFEENGFIVNLDIHTWELAAKTLKMLQDEGIYDGPISINISQVDITSIDILPVLDRIVLTNGIDKKKLHLEITESACADRKDTLVSTMNKLREAGYILEIDDFGSGYSSLNVLMHLPFDVVKLDMEFMRENNLEGKNGIIMNSIAEMIHALGAEIIVEGVETETNVENIRRFKGDIAQGYFFSRPLSVDAFKEFVVENKK